MTEIERKFFMINNLKSDNILTEKQFLEWTEWYGNKRKEKKMRVVQCTMCNINTAGQHEYDCPNNPIFIHAPSPHIAQDKDLINEIARLQIEITQLKEQLKINREKIIEVLTQFANNYNTENKMRYINFYDIEQIADEILGKE